MAIQQRDRAVTIIPSYISSAAQSTNFSTNPYDISQYRIYAMQLIITSASGLDVAVEIEESLDNTNWAVVPGSAMSFSANGTYIFNTIATGSTYARLTFTFTSGSAKFSVLAFSKI